MTSAYTEAQDEGQSFPSCALGDGNSNRIDGERPGLGNFAVFTSRREASNGSTAALGNPLNECLLVAVAHSKAAIPGFGQHLPFGRLT